MRDTDTLWELTRLPDIASNIPSYCSTEDSRMGQEIVQAYEERIFPKLVSFQKGIMIDFSSLPQSWDNVARTFIVFHPVQ